MRFALYVLVVSAVYAVLAATASDVAKALTILFVALIVVPALRHEIAHLRGDRHRVAP